MKANNRRKVFGDAVDLLMDDIEEKTAPGGLRMLPIKKIRPFHDHPFHLYEGERLEDMVASIREHGILNPVIVQEIDGGYEMLSGHNRMNAAKLVGLKEIPAIVKIDLSEEEAYIYVIETNLMQRSFSDLLISEKAAVLKARYEKGACQGKRNDILKEIAKLEGKTLDDTTCGHGDHKLKTRDSIGKEYELSGSSVGRLLKLNDLIKPFKDMLKNVVESIGGLYIGKAAAVKQENALEARFPSNSILFTELPYYDNVGYADLSDYFYIWMRRCLKDVYPELFEKVVTSKEELSSIPEHYNGDAGKAVEEYRQGFGDYLSGSIDAEATEEIRALYRTARYGSAQGSTAVTDTVASTGKKKNAAAVLTKKVGQNLPSWRDIMQPHPDVAEGRYKAAEFAADLAQVSRGEGAYEYRDPVEFFSRTYITEGMAGLLVQSLQRIAGMGGEPVIQLKTAFGGGKTHSMLALYHMVRGTTSIDYIPNLKPVLERAGLTELPKANVAVLVGTALDPTRKKNPANLPGYTVSTIWGEMAYQLVTSAGKPELYAKYIREADRKGVSPGSENLKNLFNECGPCLILMDELVAYAKKIYGVDGLPAGSYDNFVTFIQEITEAARASENSIVVASIPESDIEIGGEAGKTVLETIEHTFGRMESIWKPVAANEGFEVVRRRLFLDCKDTEAREAVCDAFSKMYQENATDFPLEAKEVEYRDRLISCYPIHPEVFDRLYGDWATLERFQRTRGVLRLMAAVIHELWMANDASAMIMPGSIPLDTPNVRDELVRHLPDTWNSIIDREVDGKDSIPYG